MTRRDGVNTGDAIGSNVATVGIVGTAGQTHLLRRYRAISRSTVVIGTRGRTNVRPFTSSITAANRGSRWCATSIDSNGRGVTSPHGSAVNAVNVVSAMSAVNVMTAASVGERNDCGEHR